MVASSQGAAERVGTYRIQFRPAAPRPKEQKVPYT